jgi:AbrB family looped-hinge helix DNA binding protein
MPTSTLTSKGQVTIPKTVRERLGLREGDRLLFLVDERGELTIRPAAPGGLGRLPGLLRHLARERPVGVEEMKRAVRRRAAAKHGRP